MCKVFAFFENQHIRGYACQYGNQMANNIYLSCRKRRKVPCQHLPAATSHVIGAADTGSSCVSTVVENKVEQWKCQKICGLVAGQVRDIFQAAAIRDRVCMPARTSLE